uniref:RING-type domain-containing protein n=1 Tax=Brugia malayi TaxID=6279 RepID=A0A7I4NNU0_BRUMA
MSNEAVDTKPVMLRCPICERWQMVNEMRQLLPCLHLFCSTCLNKKKTDKICLMLHCFSNICTGTLTLNNCDNDMCPRKLSFYDSNPIGNCKHELCICPVSDCNEPLSDSDTTELCDGCKKILLDVKYIVTKCCNARYCLQCAVKKSFLSLNPEESYANVTCPEGKCLEKDSRNSKNNRPSLQIAQCMGQDGCEGQALNGFPSSNECDHEICIDCLDKMLTECEITSSPPVCPNALCHQPYAIDSVIALKAFFPQRTKYFNHFALENQTYFLIKDESISKSEISPNFTVSSRRMEVKCELQGPDESNQTTVIFDRKGNVADFIREIRRALKILPLDKVYGYYIRRDYNKNDE